MKKEVKKRIKGNYKLVLGVIIGIMISGVGAYAATTISSSNISYDNKSSGLTSTNLNGAIDELYEKSDIRKQGKFISAYSYSTDYSTKCISGEESTCKKTECYKTKTANSCKAGDIIKYKVNDTDIVTFHVMFDNGSTLTMQSQKNTIYNTQWINKSDYLEAGGSEADFGTDGNSNKGPLTVLSALENATKGWSNVNDQIYTMGTTVFKTNKYTGCSDTSCTTNLYTLPERTAKSRMITHQEAASLGCGISAWTCPQWMYNYLDSTYGGNRDVNAGTDYWTMSASTVFEMVTWTIVKYGKLNENTTMTHYEVDDFLGARAVVIVSK